MQECKLRLTASAAIAVLFLSACGVPNNSAPGGRLNSSGTDSQNSKGIVGGEDLQRSDVLAKTVVGLYNQERRTICSGTLLPNNLVLTAAHCVDDGIDNSVIVFDIHMGDGAQNRRAVGVVMHEEFAQRSQNNWKEWADIALIRFEGSTPAGYVPAQFLPDRAVLTTQREVVLAGFGLSDGVNNRGSGVLRKTNVTICDPVYAPGEVMMDQSLGRGSCRGDSGGPAFLLVDGKHYLFGVTSRGVGENPQTCRVNSVYTNALAYRDWLKQAEIQLDQKFPLAGQPALVLVAH